MDRTWTIVATILRAVAVLLLFTQPSSIHLGRVVKSLLSLRSLARSYGLEARLYIERVSKQSLNDEFVVIDSWRYILPKPSEQPGTGQ